MLGTQQIVLEGLVTRSISASGSYTYTIITYDGAIFEFISSEFIAVGSAVKSTGFIADDGLVHSQKIELLSPQRVSDLLAVIEQKVLDSIKLNDRELLVNDEVMNTLKPNIILLAKKLLATNKLNRFVLLRFHNDADGIAGAIALTSFMKCRTFQQNSAIYDTGNAINDLSLLQWTWKPLLVLLDFGSNKESIAGLKLVQASGAEIIIIDHHPPSEKINESGINFLNSWSASKSDDETCEDEDLSKYTAGYIACEITRIANSGVIQDEEIRQLAAIACAGDKSKILEVRQSHKDSALVLDFIAAYSRYGNSLEFYKSVLKNSELFNSILIQANEQISGMRKAARLTIKEKRINGLCVYILDLENLGKEDYFPSKGKVTTSIFELLIEEKPNDPILVIGYGLRSVILRFNDIAEKQGFAANELIEKIKITMKNFVDSGGGHRKAGAVRTKTGFGKDVVEEILRAL